MEKVRSKPSWIAAFYGVLKDQLESGVLLEVCVNYRCGMMMSSKVT
jgi:hypothetical protein